MFEQLARHGVEVVAEAVEDGEELRVEAVHRRRHARVRRCLRVLVLPPQPL